MYSAKLSKYRFYHYKNEQFWFLVFNCLLELKFYLIKFSYVSLIKLNTLKRQIKVTLL